MTNRTAALGIVLSMWLTGCARSTHPATIAATQATPASAPTRCWILDRIYPVTDVAFNAHKVTRAERNEVQLWASRVSPDQRSLVRWIRDPRDKAIYVFVAEPERPGTISDWVALNANIAIDVHQCYLHAVPNI